MNSSASDLVSKINALAKDEPELVSGVKEYLVSTGVIRDSVTSKLPGLTETAIQTPANYAWDRAVYGAATNSSTRTVEHFFQDEAFLTGPLPESAKRILMDRCIPQNALMVGCGELLQTHFHEFVGQLGRDTTILDLEVKANALKATNPQLAESILRWLNDPAALKEGVSSKTGLPVTTIMEYAKDRLAYDDNARTLAHVFADETSPQQVIFDYQKSVVRPACIAASASLVRELTCNLTSSTLAAIILGTGATGVAIAATLHGVKHVYKHGLPCRKTTEFQSQPFSNSLSTATSMADLHRNESLRQRSAAQT